jgi:hypothetical protein
MNVQMIIADSARVKDEPQEDDNGGIVPEKLESKDDIRNFIQSML